MSWKMALIGGLAALGLGVTTLALTSTSAEAQYSYSRSHGGPAFHGGYHRRGHYARPAFRGGSVRGYHGGYYRGGYRGGYRGAYFGSHRYGHRRVWRGDAGGAVAAGFIGGLALGAIASAPHYRAPVYGHRYGYSPAYYGGAHYGRVYRSCRLERRVRYNRIGERIIRRVRVCY